MNYSQILQQKKMSADEAANFIKNGEIIGASGFTPAGHPKVVPTAIAQKGELEREAGREFKVTLYTGASTGDELDGALARGKVLKKRMPYQSNASLRSEINSGATEYADYHLSQLAQNLRYGFMDKVTTALVEACDVTDDGKVYLTMSNGNSPTYLQMADQIIIEYNQSVPQELKEMHDNYIPLDPPHRREIPIYSAGDRIGSPYVQVDPQKIKGIVWTDKKDAAAPFREPGEVEKKIAENVVDFLLHEEKKGRLPKGLPYQSGVGNIANAVLSQFATLPGISNVTLFTEVMQDAFFWIHEADRLNFCSTSALTFSAEGNEKFVKDIEIFKKKIMLRPQEISNHPELIRRLGLISMNAALEMDIFGNVNSTNVLGSKMMNGIGGSGDFCRNAYLSIFMCPSTSKGGAISNIVPMVTHVDHNEHSVEILVTEQGIADLRGLSPVNKAKKVISNLAHPDYRDYLSEYLSYGLEHAPSRHIPHVLGRAFELHQRFIETGSMKLS